MNPATATQRGHLSTILFAAPVTIWAAATIAVQLGKGEKLVRRVDPTGLYIPDWRFFAPTPAEHEYHLLYRHELNEEELTPWQEIGFSQRRSLLHLIWAPHRRSEKGLFDAVSELIQTTKGTKNLASMKITPAYLALLNVVTHQAQAPAGARKVQFLIIRAAEYEPTVIPDPLFLSDLHRIEVTS
ncbi:hypothetical protein [Auritidibacter ignavus]|uniref:hypothetical protein n=1 Tax=Auritidibacter ignavus TaxID=678932 RepID=UPI00244CF8DF|nr:hypothetical protein [Auritidibacter ignavus]WGH83614.1 hypothetical protein QDX20_10150 [Auritidibacter ignavus]